MGLFKNKNIVKIAQEDLNDAKLSSIEFKDELIRKRAFIDVLGARLAMKILFSQKMEANNLFSMYTIQNVLGKIDLADIYLNRLKIDVRLVFNSNEIFIPKSQFINGITPDIYFVICFNEDLSSAEFIGFIEPDKINKDNCNDDLYFIEPDKLTPATEFKKFVSEFVKADALLLDTEKEKAEELFMPLIDNEMLAGDERFLLQALAKDVSLRESLVEFENFEAISNKVAQSNIIKDDSFLDVIGAQMVANDELPEGMEEVRVDITKDEDSLVTASKSKDDKKGLSVVEGAAIVGGLAAAGTIVAAGAAMASENSAASASAAATIGGAVAGSTASATAGAVSGIASAISDSVQAPKTDFSDFLNNQDSNSQPEIDVKPNDDNLMQDFDTTVEDSVTMDDSSTLDSLSDLPDFEEITDNSEKTFEDLDDLVTDDNSIQTPEESISDESTFEDLDDLVQDDDSKLSQSDVENSDVFEDLDDLVTDDNSILTPDEPINTEPTFEDLDDLVSNENEKIPEVNEESQELQDSASDLSDEDFGNSNLPDIDFSDMDTLDADDSSSIDKPETDLSLGEAVSEEISPEEQIENDPDALKELNEKIKDSQIAHMPDYFNQPMEESSDLVEDVVDDELNSDGANISDTDETQNDINSETPEQNLNEDEASQYGFNAVEDSSDGSLQEGLSSFDALEEELPELNVGDLPKIEEAESLEPLKSLDDFPQIENENLQEQEDKENEDVVSLDNFDFDMFEKDVDATRAEEGSNSNVYADDELASNTSAENQVQEAVNNESYLNSNADSDMSEQLIDGEVEDYDNLVENADSDLKDITSQVDAFLNDIQLDDTQKSILAEEIDIDEEVLNDKGEENEPEIFAQEVQEEIKAPLRSAIVEDNLLPLPSEIEIEPEVEDFIGKSDDAETLEVLFKNDSLQTDEALELGERTNKFVLNSSQKKQAIIAASVAGAIIISLGVVGVMHSSQNKDINFPKSMNEQANVAGGPSAEPGMSGNMATGAIPGDAAGNPNVPNGIGAANPSSPMAGASRPEDMGQAVSSAFTSQAVNAQVSKIAWEVPEGLAYSAGFRRYLQTAGKNLKLSLQNDLLLATEMAYSNKCVVDVLLSSSGGVQNVSLISTSGSKQIDNIVLQSVKETLNYLKAPSSDLSGHSADLTLIINF